MAETRTLPVRVKIVSDGTLAGTRMLTSEGVELDLPIERISWEIDTLEPTATVTLRFYFDEMLPMEVDGQARWVIFDPIRELIEKEVERIVFKDGSEWGNRG